MVADTPHPPNTIYLITMANPILVVEYDTQWPGHFLMLRTSIANALDHLAAAIEHVGSTAVPSLAAKPIIDIDVLLTPEASISAAIDRLATLGYVHQGDLGIPGREAFLTPANSVPHHLYVCPSGSREFQRHLAFRDYLRTHPHAAAAYGELKKSLASHFRDNRSAYTDAKSGFVEDILSRAGNS
jgi:GrpB-like predicted nucleotidyltransferase (UPF0157 family)